MSFDPDVGFLIRNFPVAQLLLHPITGAIVPYGGAPTPNSFAGKIPRNQQCSIFGTLCATCSRLFRDPAAVHPAPGYRQPTEIKHFPQSPGGSDQSGTTFADKAASQSKSGRKNRLSISEEPK
ncbi:hypothetical protein [uncultured Thalassospira sp.]|uniref:hypothetical protein n=1 Tax=uncultured Thalassospira sp. TaxID=404382 RepID=UPI002583B0A7|nr:hypothetical protein [uncultured Thalassospira sp.]